MKRAVIAWIVAGVVLFLWGYVAHAVLPLGSIGLKGLPDEQATLAEIESRVTEPGLYFFPYMEHSAMKDKARREVWEKAYAAGPRGLLLYDSGEAVVWDKAQLGTQLATDFVSALLAVCLALLLRPAFGRRLLGISLVGVFAWLTVIVPYWNWYHYPADWMVAGLIDTVVGWILAGIVIAWILKPTGGE